jgi:membrane glycosyltransferase
LLIMTVILLFGPKVLSLIHVFASQKRLASFGGPLKVLVGSILETLFSALTAPVMVWFHTRFVLRNLGGQTVAWNTQTRGGGEGGPRWSDIAREYWPLPILGIALGAAAWWISPAYLAWLSPMLVGLVLAIPVAQISARTDLFRNLFLTPDEIRPPRELTQQFKLQLREGDQFVHAVTDPFYNAVHVALQRDRGFDSPSVDQYVESLMKRLFKDGPDSLSAQEKRAFLGDGPSLALLHTLVWKTPAQLMNPAWVKALEQYRSAARGHRPEADAIEALLNKARSAA